jgi:hypothetical protein
MHLKSLKQSPGRFISSHNAMILAARLSVYLQIAKKHPVILHPLHAPDPPSSPFAGIFNFPLFNLRQRVSTKYCGT